MIRNQREQARSLLHRIDLPIIVSDLKGKVRVWNRALTQAEIQANMLKEITTANELDDLLVYFPLNDPAGSTQLVDLARGLSVGPMMVHLTTAGNPVFGVPTPVFNFDACDESPVSADRALTGCT